MFAKIVILAYSLAVSFAAWHGPLAGGKPADLYPAGVSPHACPNYPHCDNPAVAANPSGYYGGYAAHGGAYGGGWNDGHGHGHGGYTGGAHDDGKWHGHNDPLYSGKYTGDGDYRGEGLAESGAFGPVHHGGHHGNPVYAGAYGHHGHAVQYPAGVDPHSCPNYPYCH